MSLSEGHLVNKRQSETQGGGGDRFFLFGQVATSLCEFYVSEILNFTYKLKCRLPVDMVKP